MRGLPITLSCVLSLLLMVPLVTGSFGLSLTLSLGLQFPLWTFLWTFKLDNPRPYTMTFGTQESNRLVQSYGNSGLPKCRVGAKEPNPSRGKDGLLLRVRAEQVTSSQPSMDTMSNTAAGSGNSAGSTTTTGGPWLTMEWLLVICSFMVLTSGKVSCVPLDFGVSFSSWWTTRRCVGLQDPGFIPVSPPPAHVGYMLCEAFMGEIRAFERTLAAAKITAQANAHKANPNLIYRDTKRPMPEPVTSLLISKKTRVTEVRPDEGAVLVDSTVDFDADVPVLVDSCPVGLIHATDDALYLSDLSSVAVGSQICQTQPIGRLEDVFAAFHDQWKQRWCRHDHVPFDRWDQLIAFARAHLPHGLAPETCITPDLLRAEAASKKASSCNWA